MINLRIVILILYLCDISAQLGVPDNAGTEFVFAFGSNHLNDLGTLEVFVTTRKHFPVSFNYTSQGLPTKLGSVKAGDMFSYTVPDTYRMSTRNGIEDKAQIIQSSDEIIVYVSNKQVQSTDSFMALPTDVLGKDYIVPAWPCKFWRECGSMLVIAATEDDTSVSIMLHQRELVPKFTLNRGQVFQYYARPSRSGEPLSDPNTVIDVTGALVKTDKRVSVSSGNKRTEVHTMHFANGSRLSGDHIVEMIPPVSTLGREFLTSTTYGRKGDIYRFIAANDDISMNVYRSSTKSNSTKVLKDVGDFQTILTQEDEVMHITTTGPVIVAQYTQSEQVDDVGFDFDPMMSLVTPKEQYGNYYTFTTPTDGFNNTYRNYVNIIIETSKSSGLLLDNMPVTETFSSVSYIAGNNIAKNSWAQDDWQEIGISGYSARTLAVTHGTHSLYHTEPTTVFNALMYGQVAFESYGCPAGTRLSPIGDYCVVSYDSIGDGIDNDCDNKIDEELLNNIDDDGDGLIDEDTAAHQITTTTTPTTTTTTTTTTPTTTTTTSTTTTTPTTSTTPTTTTTTIPTTTSTTPTTTTTTPTTTTTTPTTTTTTPTTTTKLTSTATTTPPTTTTTGIPTTTIPTITSTTPATTTDMSNCAVGNITKQLQRGEKTVDVETQPGTTMRLPAGEYIIMMTSQLENCTIHLSIIRDSTQHYCDSDKQYSVASRESGEGSLDILCGDVIHRISLPVGDYKYEKIHEDYNCSASFKVTDYQLVRRLNIRAEYEVQCDLLSDPITRSAVKSLAQSHLVQIDGPIICGSVCKRQKGGQAVLNCVNHTLSILWPTDQTYGGNVTAVPSSIQRTIRDKLRQVGGPLLKIFIIELQPPVVLPVRTDVILTTSCLNDKMYVAETDSCE